MAAASDRALDQPAVARVLARWAAAAEAPWLHAEVARRMGERLAVIRLVPATVLEWWGHAGGSDTVLQAAYPKARRLRVEPTPASQRRSAEAAAAPWWSARRWSAPAVEVLDEAAVAPASAQLLWSNMMLHTQADPPALIARWRQAVEVGGFLMFSTLGPGTLAELRTLYRAQGWGSPAAAFVDMHDFGDMLVQAGFADPVMDQETLDLSWPTPEALLAELRGLGGNADPLRHPGLRTPRWHRRLLDALRERAAADGRIHLSFELAYGHAFVPAPRPKLGAQTEVTLADMRSMVRTPRRSSGR